METQNKRQRTMPPNGATTQAAQPLAATQSANEKTAGFRNQGAGVNRATPNKDKAFASMIAGEYRPQFMKVLQKVLGTAGGEQSSRPMQKMQDLNGELANQQAQQAFDEVTEKDRLLLEAQQEITMLREALRKIHASARVLTWSREADKLKKSYPDFDLQTEMQNPHFEHMLKQKDKGGSLQKAYEFAHFDELKQQFETRGAQQMAQKIEQRRQRPIENGLLTGMVPAAQNKQSAKDRQNIAERVARGETIRF